MDADISSVSPASAISFYLFLPAVNANSMSHHSDSPSTSTPPTTPASDAASETSAHTDEEDSTPKPDSRWRAQDIIFAFGSDKAYFISTVLDGWRLHGEEATADLVANLPDRIRNGEYNLDRVLQ